MAGSVILVCLNDTLQWGELLQFAEEVREMQPLPGSAHSLESYRCEFDNADARGLRKGAMHVSGTGRSDGTVCSFCRPNLTCFRISGERQEEA